MKKVFWMLMWAALTAGCYESGGQEEAALIDCELFCDADNVCANYCDPAAAYANCLETCDELVALADGDADRGADMQCLGICTGDGADAYCDGMDTCIDGCNPWFWYTTCSAHCNSLDFCGIDTNVDDCDIACEVLDATTQECLFACDQAYAGVTGLCGDLESCTDACL
jgi:hypothetical protein